MHAAAARTVARSLFGCERLCSRSNQSFLGGRRHLCNACPQAWLLASARSSNEEEEISRAAAAGRRWPATGRRSWRSRCSLPARRREAPSSALLQPARPLSVGALQGRAKKAERARLMAPACVHSVCIMGAHHCWPAPQGRERAKGGRGAGGQPNNERGCLGQRACMKHHVIAQPSGWLMKGTAALSARHGRRHSWRSCGSQREAGQRDVLQPVTEACKGGQEGIR